MSRIRKRLLGMLGSIMIAVLAYGSTQILAEEAVSARLEQVQLENDKLTFYVNHNQGEEWQVMPENSTLVVDGQICGINSISSVKKEEMPVSYVMMADISGSMDEERMDAVKQMINEFTESKGPQDNFCITTMGDNLNSSGLLQDAAEISDYVEQISVTSEDTNLYQSIKDELGMMGTMDGLHTKKCLIIFSDGAEDQKTGITREEAEAAVKAAEIPVFTVAMLKNNPTEAQTEAAKVLGSFARYSAGGAHYAPVVEGLDNGEICGKIQNILKNSLLVRVEVAGLELTKDTAGVSLTLSDGTTAVAMEYQLSGEVLDQIKALNEPEAATEAAEPEPMVEDTDNSNITGILIAVLVAVLLVTLVIVIVNKSRKGKPVAVHFVRVNGEEEEHDFVVKEEIKVGRGRRCQLCLEDSTLSEVHCSILRKQEELFVKDENSTNGTYVNGVPIVGAYRLEQGDVILMGSCEYRITWK